jgi:hypothetical protein
VPAGPLHDLVVQPLADAFLDVGVYVALFAACAAVVRWRTGDRLSGLLRRHRSAGPVIGATLGVSPGCGGAVLVMPLYVRGEVSFGTVVAALTATMGDSSWVIMAGDPVAAAQVHAILFATGLVTGHVVDAVGLDPARWRRPVVQEVEEDLPAPEQVLVGTGTALPAPVPSGAGAPAALLAAVRPGAARALATSLPAFWALTGLGVGLGIPVSFRLLDPALLPGASAGLDLTAAVGALGGLACLAVYVHRGVRLADDDRPARGVWAPELSTGLRHAAHETAFVVTWVAVAYALLAGVDLAFGSPLDTLPVVGLVGVGVGALLGLVPGCGLQIAFTGMFLAGGVPLPTLVANAVAQDGDALLPLIALDRRAAAVASVITTVPALVVGTAVLLAVG